MTRFIGSSPIVTTLSYHTFKIAITITHNYNTLQITVTHKIKFSTFHILNCLERRFMTDWRIPLNSLHSFLYRLGTDHAQKTPIIVDVFIVGDCLATSLGAYCYSNGLPIVVMQYEGKVFTKLLPSNGYTRYNMKLCGKNWVFICYRKW
jgi:hypothetical protein